MRRKLSQSEEVAPVVSIDYMFMGDNQQEGEEKGIPIVVVKDRKTKIIRSRLVPQKGINGYAIKVGSGIIESLGHSRVIFKSDQEPSLLSLKDVVKSETRINLVLEESPEYESRAMGKSKGQYRQFRDSSEQ